MTARSDLQPLALDVITKSPGRLVEILRRPLPPDASSLPQGLYDYVQSIDANLVLDYAGPNIVAMRSGTGQYTLLVQDLPGSTPIGERVAEATDAEKDTRKWFLATLREAKEMGFQQREDGALVRADCVLYVQSKAQRQALDDEARLQFLMQDSPTAAREFAEGLSDKLGLKNVLGRGEGLFPLTDDRLHDHVKRGQPRHPAGE